MKNSKLFSYLLLLAAVMFSIQCTTDPIPGPPGEDGVDGIDGIDGAKGTAECAVCHNVAKSEAVHASFPFSIHSNPEEFYTRGTSSCQKCHSSEGYIEYAIYGENTSQENPSVLNCTTCHDMHTSFDFETDGFDYALRITEPVQSITDESFKFDYGKDNQTNHTCATCHNMRRSFEDFLQEDETVRIYNRFGPHHNPQANLLEGIQGQEIAGSTPYEGTDATAAHRAGLGDNKSSCTICHMAEPSAIDNGNHSWNPSLTNCAACHGDDFNYTIGDGPAGLKEDMETLEAKLIELGILVLNEDNEPEPVHPEIFVPLIQGQAAWNFMYVLEDQSNGLHNPDYARALIKNSIEALNAN